MMIEVVERENSGPKRAITAAVQLFIMGVWTTGNAFGAERRRLTKRGRTRELDLTLVLRS